MTLSLGIGATTGLYALVRAIQPGMPGVADTSELGRVYASSPSLGVERSPVALSEYDASLSHAASFSAIGAYAEEDAMIGIVPTERVVTAGYASPAFFQALGVQPAAGRLFTAADIDATRPVAIVSQAFWRRQFPDGALTTAVLRVDGIDRAVVGVMPPDFAYGFVGIGADVWIPLGHPSVNVPSIVSVFARLRPGSTWKSASIELAALSKGRGQWIWHAIPVDDDLHTRAVGAYASTLGPAALVLLIVCINVACLLMARGIARDQELSVRRALGATRARIVRLLLLENATLAVVSGTIGAGLAIALLRVLASALAGVPGMTGRIQIDASLLPIALASSALACLLFGTVPALRLSKRDVAAWLKGESPRQRVHIAGYGARDLIVFGEIAASVGLIVWTAMLFTLMGELRGVRLMFPAERVVAVRLPGAAIGAVAPTVAAIPGVIGVTSSSSALSSGTPVRARTDAGRTAQLESMPVGAEFFKTLGLRIVRGRGFDRTESDGANGVAVLSETAARQLSPGEDVVGLRLRLTGHGASSVVVIGVAADPVDFGGLGRAGLTPGDVFLPFTPSALDATLLVRTAADPHPLLAAIADASKTPLMTRPVRPSVVGDEFQRRDADSGAVMIRLIGGFALLSLLLAGIGVFAVISQSVAQRTREFGIRLAIGATPRSVLLTVVKREARLIAAAIGTGLMFTIGLTRLMFVQLTTLSIQMPALSTGALLFTVLGAAIAVAFATWRILRLEPAAVLRRT